MSTTIVDNNTPIKKSFKKKQTRSDRIRNSLTTVENLPEPIDELVEETVDHIRAPICSIFGHVDHGKTTLLDCLRGTDLQAGEAGGITQHIGSTFIPSENINGKTQSIKGTFAVPPDSTRQLLFIDTPGHKHFGRSRANAIDATDLGILIIDIKEGIQPQTEEAIRILKEKKIPFVIAATKLDKVNGWNTTKCSNLTDAFKQQDKAVIPQIDSHIQDIKYDLSKHGIEAEYYFKNKKPERVFSIVPVSARTSEGIADLLALLVYISNNWMMKKLTKKDTFKCQILETKFDKTNGYTIDVILINGTISVGDKFGVPTTNGAVISTVRSILEPAPLTQLGKKTTWTKQDTVTGSIGVKLFASNLEGAYSGTQIFKVEQSQEHTQKKADDEIEKIWRSYTFKSPGVYLCVETLNELDACYTYLNETGISVAYAYIGSPSLKIIERIAAASETEKLAENKVCIYFGKFDNMEVVEYAKERNITIIHSEVIYKLSELYTLEKAKFIKLRQEMVPPVYPVELEIIKKFIFMTGGKEHLLFGVKVKKGILYKQTPICVPGKKISLGAVSSIQHNKKELLKAEQGMEVCIRLTNTDGFSIGRHFETTDTLIAAISRESIDILKRDYKEVVTKEQWLQIIEHKKLLGI